MVRLHSEHTSRMKVTVAQGKTLSPKTEGFLFRCAGVLSQYCPRRVGSGSWDRLCRGRPTYRSPPTLALAYTASGKFLWHHPSLEHITEVLQARPVGVYPGVLARQRRDLPAAGTGELGTEPAWADCRTEVWLDDVGAPRAFGRVGTIVLSPVSTRGHHLTGAVGLLPIQLHLFYPL